MKNFIKYGLLSAALISGLGINACSDSVNDGEAGRSGEVISSGEVEIGGAFTLVNQDGEVVTEKSLLGQPSLIYFGFTYCPDVCPTALQKLGLALSELDPKGEYFRPVLFTVDPQRDTPEALKLYVTANGFPAGLQGYTGTQEQMDVAIKAYKIFAAKVEDEDSTDDDYLMDHSNVIYLFDAEGKFVTFFGGAVTPAEMSRKLSAHKAKNPL